MNLQKRLDMANERIGHLWPVRNRLKAELEAIDKEVMMLYKQKWAIERVLVGVKKVAPFTQRTAKKRQFKQEDLMEICKNFKSYSPTKQEEILEKLRNRIASGSEERGKSDE